MGLKIGLSSLSSREHKQPNMRTSTAPTLRQGEPLNLFLSNVKEIKEWHNTKAPVVS